MGLCSPDSEMTGVAGWSADPVEVMGVCGCVVGTTYAHHLHDRKWVAQLVVCLHLESEICPLQQVSNESRCSAFFIAHVSMAFSLVLRLRTFIPLCRAAAQLFALAIQCGG